MWARLDFRICGDLAIRFRGVSLTRRRFHDNGKPIVPLLERHHAAYIDLHRSVRELTRAQRLTIYPRLRFSFYIPLPRPHSIVNPWREHLWHFFHLLPSSFFPLGVFRACYWYDAPVVVTVQPSSVPGAVRVVAFSEGHFGGADQERSGCRLPPGKAVVSVLTLLPLSVLL